VSTMLANRYMMEGAYTRAIKEYRRALESGRPRGLIWCKLIIAYILNGSFDSALSEFARMLREKPEDIDKPQEKDKIYSLSYNKAINEITGRLRKTPNDMSLHNCLGILLYFKGMRDQAMAEWSISLNVNRSQPVLSHILELIKEG